MEAAGLIGGASPRLRRSSGDADVEAELLSVLRGQTGSCERDREEEPWTSEIARVWELAWPSILTSLLEFLPTPLNLLAIGHFGDKDEVAAFALGSSQFPSPFYTIIRIRRISCLTRARGGPSVW